MSINIPFKSGGKSMAMPLLVVPEKTLLTMRDGGSVRHSNLSNFYAAIETDHTKIGYDAATLSNTTGTEEQTIVDTGTGQQGVLTQVLLPSRGADGVQTIRVTMDGKVTEFTPEVSPTDANAKVMLGDFMPWAALPSTTSSIGYGSFENKGWGALTEHEFVMLTPNDSLTRSLPVGMIFKDSMKVTIQTTGAFTVGSATNKACAAWLTSIPEGVE